MNSEIAEIIIIVEIINRRKNTRLYALRDYN